MPRPRSNISSRTDTLSLAWKWGKQPDGLQKWAGAEGEIYIKCRRVADENLNVVADYGTGSFERRARTASSPRSPIWPANYSGPSTVPLPNLSAGNTPIHATASVL